jgi:mannose-1-phosphate guanylyltransferase
LSAVTGGVPKQYFSLGGGPTLIEDAVGRMAPLSPRHRRVTIVDRSHLSYVRRLPHVAELGRVLYQPADRGTAAGVLLGLTEILSRNPAAVVVVTPADHGVANVGLFRSTVEAAIVRVLRGQDLVLFGIEPAHAAEDYGWITPARGSMSAIGDWSAVDGFHEKPDGMLARALFEQGAVWNTMVLACRAGSLFAQFRRHAPALTAAFEQVLTLDPAGRDEYFRSIYPALPAIDFSRDILGRARGLTLHKWPAHIGWSDLGTPERLRDWLRSHGPGLTAPPRRVAVPA